MNRLTHLGAASTVIALALGSNYIALAQETATPVTFNVSAITDYHGHFEQVTNRDGVVTEPGAAVLACMLPKLADGNDQTIVSVGDNIGGSAFSSALLNDTPTLEILSAMGVEASAVGNHEFDKGYDDLVNRVGINGDGEAKFTYLGANVTGRDPRLKAQIIKEFDGVKVAFLGTVTDSTPGIVAGEGVAGLNFANPLEVTNDMAREIKAAGEADVVVALIHEGDYTPEQFGPDVDVALGGHTHQVINEVTTKADGSPFVWAQAGNFGKAVADVDLTFDPATKKLVDIQSRVIETPEIMQECGESPVPEIQEIMDRATAEAATEGDRPVATLEHDFLKGWNESHLGNMIAEASKQGLAAKTSVSPDLGLINPGGVRADLFAGEVTYKEAFDIQPFGNDMSYGSYTGTEIKEVLEQQWQTKNGNESATFLGWSDNFSYTFDDSRPKGDRITSITIDGEPIDPAKTYVVTAGSFLLGGGDNFTALKNGTTQSTGLLDVDVFTDYLANHQDIAPRTGQVAVGVSFADAPAPGQPLTINLSSLAYQMGETVTTATATLGDATAAAPVDVKGGDVNFGTNGTATITLDVPADITGEQVLKVTTDAGTDIDVPVSFAAGETPEPQDPQGSSDSLKSILANLPGAALIIAALERVADFLAPEQLANLRKLFGQLSS